MIFLEKIFFMRKSVRILFSLFWGFVAICMYFGEITDIPITELNFDQTLMALSTFASVFIFMYAIALFVSLFIKIEKWYLG